MNLRATVLVAVCGFVAACPTRVSAWTDTHVESARAVVRVAPDGGAEVDLTLRIGIHGGWLEGLEIAGLDADRELVGDVRFVDSEGTSYQPRVRPRDGGSLWLRFDRRSAPRRGEYEVSLSYRTQLASAAAPTDGGYRVSWTLPGWRDGLDGVQVEVHAPRGTEIVPTDEDMAAIQTEREDAGDHVVLRWRRAHMPRTMAWTVQFDVPTDAARGALAEVGTLDAGAPEPRGVAVSEPVRPPQAPPVPVSMVWWMLVVSLLGMARFERAARARGTRARPLLPLPAGARAGLALAVALAASGLAAERPWTSFAALAALAVLGWQRTPLAPSARRLGAWRALRADETIGTAPPSYRFFDGRQPLGALAACAAFGVAWMLMGAPRSADAFIASIVVIPWLHGVESRLPRSLEARRRELLHLARALRVPLSASVAVGLFAHEDAEGALQDVRLRLITPARPDGLVRFDIVCGEVAGPGGLHAALRVVVVTREGSGADAIARRVLCDEASMPIPGGRVARCGTIEHAWHLARAFVPSADASEPKRRTATRRPRHTASRAAASAH